jgi:glycosyltransferase involved in cell wall biosynthesis
MNSGDPMVLQATAWYPPDQLGGTEVYMQGLIAALGDLGVQSKVVRPASERQAYVHEGIEVLTYPPRRNAGLDAQLAALETHLRAYPGAIYHQHTWTPDCGSEHLRLAKSLGHRTILTVHVPGPLCLRGDMMLNGAGPCDGQVLTHRCAACWARSRGAPEVIASALASIPQAISRRAGDHTGRLATALSAPAMAARQGQMVAEMIADADVIVAVCDWLKSALIANGVASEKIVLSRQGVSREFIGLVTPTRRPLRRFLFLGRWTRVKGIDVIVSALRLRPSLPIRLTLRAIVQTDEDQAYRQRVRALAGDDPRIVFAEPVTRADLPSALSDEDALLIPSVWLETGPLVALEALAAGLYVIGSRLGGIAELIDQPWKGKLVRAGEPEAWAQALETACGATPPPPPAGFRVRTMEEVGLDMANLYRRLD